MSKCFIQAEHDILNLFQRDTHFTYQNMDYTVIASGKPYCNKGEPKTDIYILAISNYGIVKEFKISFKKQNADFLENKINAQRAKQIFGENWQYIISNATYSLKNEFLNRHVIYKTKCGKTDAGAITLGWKFELLNKLSGQLSGNMMLSEKQVIDVYAGTNISDEKRHAYVHGKIIQNSGIANFMLFEKQSISSAQCAINALVSIKNYVTQHPHIYFACKALNYRSFISKYDGNRPLAVFVHWYVKNGKIAYHICFDNPLMVGGDKAYYHLKHALDTLHIKNTDDFHVNNISESVKIYQ